jgi:hypothetical protein
MVAAECELILLFDPQKLGISHEFKCVIASLCRHHKKYVVLHKAEQVDTPAGIVFCCNLFVWSIIVDYSKPIPVHMMVSVTVAPYQ